MAVSKLTVFIVHGAWHQPSSWNILVSHLEAAGNEVVVGKLSSVKPIESSTINAKKDTEAIRQQLLPLTENDEKDVLLVTHSYGGIPGGEAASGLSKVERSKANRKGGIIGLVYITAFVVPEGISIVEFLGRRSPFIQANQPSEGFCMPNDPISTFYHDVDSELASTLEKAILPHDLLTLNSPAAAPAWKEPEYEGRLVFLRCTEDKCLPLRFQDMFIEKSGVKWLVKNLEASHSPFASLPEELTKLLMGWAKAFLSMDS